MADSEIYLNPGGIHFHTPNPNAPSATHIRTLLGSCVSIVLWHPQRRLAGMSHAVLPGRSRRNEQQRLDARYCDETVILLGREIARAGALPKQFQVYLVGGGRMYASTSATAVGERNVEATRSCLIDHGFVIRGEHVGKDGHRKVEINLQTGRISVLFANQHVVLADDLVR